jgi:serine protease SohB
VHASFIDLVKERRGSRLKSGEDLFTGAFWSGQKALELGLIDGLADVRTKMRALFGDDVRLKLVAPSTSWFRRKRGVFAEGGGFEFGFAPGGLAADLISAVEARALWSRFGF